MGCSMLLVVQCAQACPKDLPQFNRSSLPPHTLQVLCSSFLAIATLSVHHSMCLLSTSRFPHPAPSTLCAQDAYFYEAPLPCKPSEMPKFETSHEMAMKRARHEGRYQQQQGYQTQQQAQRRQQGPGQGPGGYQGQQGARGGQAAQGGPPAQRQRTQGAYGGPTMGQGQGGYGSGQQGGHGQPYRGGGAPAAGMAPPGQQQQQQYRGGGAPAAGGMPGAGGRAMPAAGLAAGMMPAGQPVIFTTAQVQGMMAQGMMAAPPGMMAPGAGGYAGAYGQQPGRGPPGGFSGQHGRPNPHGGAEPEWNRQRR